MLTKAIVKFPPGTSERWKVIADFCGKDQKAAISKAKEMQQKQIKDVEERRQEEIEKKAKLEKMRKETEAAARKKHEEEKKAATTVDPNAWTADQQK